MEEDEPFLDMKSAQSQICVACRHQEQLGGVARKGKASIDRLMVTASFERLCMAPLQLLVHGDQLKRPQMRTA